MAADAYSLCTNGGQLTRDARRQSDSSSSSEADEGGKTETPPAPTMRSGPYITLGHSVTLFPKETLRPAKAIRLF